MKSNRTINEFVFRLFNSKSFSEQSIVMLDIQISINSNKITFEDLNEIRLRLSDLTDQKRNLVIIKSDYEIDDEFYENIFKIKGVDKGDVVVNEVKNSYSKTKIFIGDKEIFFN